MLKNLLGNNSNNNQELAEEMRAILKEIQDERARYQELVDTAQNSSDKLKKIHEPIARATKEADAVSNRLAEIEKRLDAMTKLAGLFQDLDERATRLAQNQEAAEARIHQTNEDSQKVRSVMEELAAKVDIAVNLKDQLHDFLEVEKPFHQLRGEADTLRNQVEGTGEHLARLREQHDRLLDAHKLAMSKMEALDRRRDDMGRSLTDKERRVAGVEQAIRNMDGVQQALDDARREMATLKATADLLGQKTAALEVQRETVDRALAQAEHLDQAMRQIDMGVKQQQANEKLLGTLTEQLATVRALHEQVAERSSAISQLQREIDERIQTNREEMASVSDESKKAMERFDFERRGIESVTQRVADLRAAVSDCEGRFKGLANSNRAVSELKTQTQALADNIQLLTTEAATIEGEMTKLQGIRRDLGETAELAHAVNAQVTQVAQQQPVLEAAIRDLQQLQGAHASVKDALEQTQYAHSEMARMRDAHADTRTWLAETTQSLGQLKAQAAELQAMQPTVEFVQKQTQRIGDSMISIEQRREFFDALHRRAAELESLGGQLDERGKQLQARMDAAEQRFTTLGNQAEEAERMTMALAALASNLNVAEQDAEAIRKSVTATGERAQSLEKLSEQSQALRKELEQRSQSVAAATRELERASALREESSAAAQQLAELSKQLGSSLGTANQSVQKVAALCAGLEDRANGLRIVEKRLGQFDERLAKWEVVDQEVTRALEQIAVRQRTIESLQADLERMFTLAETTQTHVREITSKHQEIEESRALLADVFEQLQEVRNTASSLDERRRQLGKAEDRLARADSLLTDVRSSLEALEGQKAIVDQVVEKSGSLQYLLKQAEATIEGLREERKTTDRVRSAVATALKDEPDTEVERAEAA